MTQANSYETKMHMDREYIIHMLKYGKQDEIRQMVQQGVCLVYERNGH